MNQIGILSCVAFALLTAGYLLAIQWRALRRSRWTQLSTRYPSFASSAAPLSTFRDATVRVNTHWYWRVATIALGSSGLDIEFPAPILRLRHKPLSIPWDDITPAGSPEEGMLLLQIGDAATITLTETAALGMQYARERQTKRAHHIRARK